jgi:hypothetical protein
MIWSPPRDPRDMVRMATRSPEVRCALSVPAAPISTSSGCAPMASTTSRPAARAARPPLDQRGGLGHQQLGRDRLLQELRRRAAQRGHGVVHGGVAGQHGHRQVRHQLAGSFQQFEAGHPGQLDVGDEEVPALRLDPAQPGRRVRLVHDLEATAGAQHPAEVTPQRRVVVDQQDPPVRTVRVTGFHSAPRPESARRLPSGPPAVDRHPRGQPSVVLRPLTVYLPR